MSFFENISQFHFLRPVWLVGLLALPLVYFALKKRALSNSDWANAIDPRLLKHLLPSDQQQQKESKHISMILVLAFSFIAMSGPAWQQKPQDVVKLTDNMVVILDLSISMLSTDTAPDRLTRSKQKLQDLLKLRKEGNTALIAFSGDSHVVTPLTDDTNTIIANLPALDPYIMPVIGSRPDLAVAQAIQLLEQGKAKKGRIVLLTDSVETTQAKRITDMLEKTDASLLILAAGTSAGAPIKLPDQSYLKNDGSVVIPKTDFTSLETLANDNRGHMMRMTLDDQDLNQLNIEGNLALQDQEGENEPTMEKGFDAWDDMGFLLLILVIPLVLKAHRQGILIILALFFIPVDQSYAFGWSDLWQTPDQQAQKLLDQGDASEAAKQFKSTEHKAAAHYQAEEYEQAATEYSQLKDADSYYNQGNALAQQQKFKEAIDAYNQALEQEPGNEDALYNRNLIEEFLKQQQESSEQDGSENQDSENQDSQNKDSDQENSSQNSEQQQENQQDQRDQQDQQDQQNNQQSNTSQDQEDEQSQQQHKNEDEQSESDTQQQQQQQEQQQQQQQAEGEDEQDPSEASAIPAPDELSEEEKQSYEQWMRRVPDDPGGLLRRKFEQQSRDRNRNEREAGDPIW